MLLINKGQGIQMFLMTVTEKGSTAPTYHLKLHSNYTNQDYAVALGPNLSPHPTRYDEFEVSTAAFNAVPDGMYEYAVVDLAGVVMERGMVKVFTPGETEEAFTVITPADEEDDFITYPG